MSAIGDRDGDVGGKCGDVRVMRDADHSTVHMRGEHDTSTMVLVSAALADAITADDGDVVVDLRDVTFMNCSTVRALVEGRSLLAEGNRRLVVRLPSVRQRWFLELCGLRDLIDDKSVDTLVQTQGAATALESWVKVPATAPVTTRRDGRTDVAPAAW